MLSKETILQSSDPYILVTDYINEFHIEFGDEGVSKLRIGLQWALLLLDLDSEFHNGGLWQYFGNRTVGKLVNQSTVQVQTVLLTMGAIEMSDIVRQAFEYWITVIHAPSQTTDKIAFFKSLEEEFERFNKRFYRVYDDSVSIIQNYIISHVDDFCHIE